MAPTPAQLAALDQAHRQRQAANAEAIAKAVLAYWLLVDPDDISGSGLAWLDRSTTAVVAGRERSAVIAGAYATAIRRLHYPGEPAPTPATRPANIEQIRKSLAYTGLGRAALKVQQVKQVAGGDIAVSRSIADIYRRQREQARGLASPLEREERALDAAISQIMQETAPLPAAAAVRHVQNAGRDMVMDFVQADARAVGYVRITDGNPCYFCSMLASRGPVFREDSFDRSDPRFTGSGNVKVHDSCSCQSRPVFSMFKSEWPDLSVELSAEWEDMRRDKHGELDLMEAWRRKREGRPWRHDEDIRKRG